MYSFSQYYCWGHEVLCSVSVSSLNMQSGSPGINLDETLQFSKPPRNTWECVSECGERRWLKWWDESRGTCEVYWWLRCRHRQQHSSIYTNTISFELSCLLACKQRPCSKPRQLTQITPASTRVPQKRIQRELKPYSQHATISVRHANPC